LPAKTCGGRSPYHRGKDRSSAAGRRAGCAAPRRRPGRLFEPQSGEQGAGDAARQGVQGRQDDDSEDDEAIMLSILQHLGRDREKRRADQRAGAAEQHREQEKDRIAVWLCFSPSRCSSQALISNFC
jgi:hypothetical protein